MTRDDAIRQHRLAKARRAGDRLAVAVLEADRSYTPPEPDYPVFVLRRPSVWAGLRWSAAA